MGEVVGVGGGWCLVCYFLDLRWLGFFSLNRFLLLTTTRWQITLDGITYAVGGGYPLADDGRTPCPLPVGVAPPDNCPTAYFNRTTGYAGNLSAFQFSNYSVSRPTAPFTWAPQRHAPSVPWPPAGVHLAINCTAPADALPAHQRVIVTLHYELYDNVPIMAKWISVHQPTQVQRPQPRPAKWQQPVDSGDIPLDQQGPICLQTCDQTLPPSNWLFRFLLQPETPNASIVFAAARKLCLTLVQGSAYHSFNDQLDARPCNDSDSLQRWTFDPHTGLIATNAADVDLQRIHVCQYRTASNRALEPAPCFLDVNNHQSIPETTLQMAYNASASVAKWTMVNSSIADNTTMLATSSFGNWHGRTMCAFYTPLPPPPLPPPPPSPKPKCISPECVILTHADIEILRLNQPWTSADASGLYSTFPNSGQDIGLRQVHDKLLCMGANT